MADISEHVDSVAALIYEQYEKRGASEKARTYLGASIIGKECSRALWYDFRWATREQFDGRMLRLFQTGHLEEPRMVADLRAIGVTVYDSDPATGKQFGFSDHGGHMKGHMDGCAKHIPGGGQRWHVLEFKTHSAKSFAELKKKGVKLAKAQHYAQMQWYMGQSGMERALYMAKNKDTDELYTERVEFDKVYYEQLQARALSIIYGVDPPPKLSDDPKFFICNMCSHNAVCHGHKVPNLSCRTCVHATPEREGDAVWSCAAVSNQPIPVEIQRVGCPQHMVLPFLLTYAEAVDAGEGWVQYKRKDNGVEFVVSNGTPSPSGMPQSLPVYTSAEISAAHDHRIIGDQGVEEFRTTFGAVITG